MPRIMSLFLLLLCGQGLIVFTVAFVVYMPLASHYSTPRASHHEWSVRMSQTESNEVSSIVYHVVDGIECREVTIDIQTIGPVTILEATAKSQSELVDMALALDEDELMNRNQLQAGDPYGAVLWPAASTISNYLLTQCGSLEGKTILELGTGTGLVSIVASLGGAAKVIATDYEPIPLRLLEYAHTNLNKNGGTPIDTVLLDLCNMEISLPPADVVLAADIMYEPRTGRAMAQRTHEALVRGSRVVVGDSPGRAGRPAFLDELKRLGIHGAFVDVVGQTCNGPRHDLICGNDSMSVSEYPKELVVAVMDLDPKTNISLLD